MLPTPLDSFRRSLSRLRTTIHKLDSNHLLAEAKRRWELLRQSAKPLHLVPQELLPPLEAHLPAEPAAMHLASACTAVESHLRLQDTVRRTKYFSKKISARKALHLASFESGRMKSFLKKVTQDYVPKLHHVQVPTDTGGYTTNPEAVKQKFADLMQDWFRVRRQQPPTSHKLHELYSTPPRRRLRSPTQSPCPNS